MTAFEDLPVEVQTDIRDKRDHIPGWKPWTNPTPTQWMTFYQVLNAPAREYVVEQLLELGQRGSNCLQADHDSQAESFWQQLRGVVDLHNARVDEVAVLREHVRQLREALLELKPAEEIPDELKAAEAIEFPSRILQAENLRMVSVELTEHPLPGMELRVALPGQAGHDGD